jgi:hypothetical protein
MKAKILFISGLIGFLIVGVLLGVYVMQSNHHNKRPVESKVKDLQSMTQEYLYGTPTKGDGNLLEQIAEKKNVFEQYAIGFNEPIAIGFWKYDYFISSRLDKTVYQIKNDQRIPLAPSDFISDMVFNNDGSVIATVFNENRIISISPKGIISPISNTASGPSGIAWSPGGCYYVANYLKGTISCVEQGGKTTDVVKDLIGPVGLLIYNKSLYITDYLSNTSSVYSIPIAKIGKEKITSIATSLNHATGIGFVDGNMYVIHSEDNIGVISRIDKNGNSTLVAVSGLPDPVFGKFSPDRYVYLVSPNDSDGKVMRMRFEI